MRPTTQVTHHVVELYPPTSGRRTWLITCVANDFSQQYRNKVEAYDAAYGHVKEVRLAHALVSGEYEFDDGSL